MRRYIFPSCLMIFCSTAIAGEEPSIDEVEKLNQALAAVGCIGGEMEKNGEDVITYAVDGSLCDAGQFDFEFDKDFKVLKKMKD